MPIYFKDRNKSALTDMGAAAPSFPGSQRVKKKRIKQKIEFYILTFLYRRYLQPIYYSPSFISFACDLDKGAKCAHK